MTRRKEEIKEIVENLGYELIGEYNLDGRHRKIIIQDCDKYKYDVDFNGFISGKIPDFVAKGNPFTLPNISLWLEKENKSFALCENNVYNGSEKKLFFQCLRESCQEIFDMDWRHVYSRGYDCPFCRGYRVGRRNNVSYLRPDLVEEWDYSKNKKNPEDYTYGSETEISWICSKCNNSWKAFISSRSRGSGCPKCANSQKESKIASELKKYILNKYESKEEYKIFRNPETNRFLPYDIYIFGGENREINGSYIEVHDNQHYKFIPFWHKTKEKFEYNKSLDKIKKKFAKKNGKYIEVDLRKIKTSEQAIEYIEKVMENYLL